MLCSRKKLYRMKIAKQRHRMCLLSIHLNDSMLNNFISYPFRLYCSVYCKIKLICMYCFSVLTLLSSQYFLTVTQTCLIYSPAQCNIGSFFPPEQILTSIKQEYKRIQKRKHLDGGYPQSECCYSPESPSQSSTMNVSSMSGQLTVVIVVTLISQ